MSDLLSYDELVNELQRTATQKRSVGEVEAARALESAARSMRREKREWERMARESKNETKHENKP